MPVFQQPLDPRAAARPTRSARALRSCAGAALVAGIAACTVGDQGPATSRTPPSTDAVAVVDSALPTGEALRRFRAGLPDAPSTLLDGRPSREALVRDFASAVERADSAELRRLVLSKAEFAYLVYPTSAYVRPPYRQAPDIVWLQLEAGSEKGLRRLLARLGGRSLGYEGTDCAAGPEPEGDHVLWRGCAVRLAGAAAPVRLFGVIVERDGRFKFASYTNDL